MVVNSRSATFIRLSVLILAADARHAIVVPYNFMLKPTIFREYDIRGIADRHPDVELTDSGVELLGRAFGTYLQRHAGPKINLGRDTRLSSPRLRDALMRGLKAERLPCDRSRRRPHARAVLLAIPSQSRRRYDDHRQPQSRRVQRIQDCLRRLNHPRRRDSGAAPHDGIGRSVRAAMAARPRRIA